MASKFWEGSSDSESDTESVDSSSSGSAGGDFFKSSSSDDDDVRVIKSQKQKRWDQLKSTAEDLRESFSDGDWNETVKGYELLLKQVQKAKTTIDKEGLPNFFLRVLVRLEDAVEEALADKEGRKKLSPTNSKSLNAMKQRLKKNKQYEVKTAAFRENPVDTDDDEDDADDVDGEDDWNPDADSGDEGKKKGGKVEQEPQRDIIWTRTMIKTRVAELLANRGKKGTDRTGQVDELRHLVSVATDARVKAEVLVTLISAQYELRSSTQQNHIPLDEWTSVYQNLMMVLNIVETNPQLTVKENSPIELIDAQMIAKNKAAALAGEDEEIDETIIAIPGSLGAFTERLDDEFIKSLQFIDPHTQEYVQRLQDESKILLLTVRIEEYYRRQNDADAINLMALRRIERLYYKRELLNPLPYLHKAMPDLSQTATDASGLPVVEESAPKVVAAATVSVLGKQGMLEKDMKITQVIRDLAVGIYAGSNERAKARAMLCQIYNLALEEDFYQARDMFLMSHLQDSIHHADIATQILYNRAMVQLGLCAFRHGFIYEAHTCLADLYGSGRVKELMAQGITNMRYGEKNPEQEKQAKLRQMPYHMHINLELIDTVHLISAMLMEVPNMAQNSLDTKRRVISRPFRRLMDQLDRQVFNGPPENSHDFIMGATRSLMQGEVTQCWEMLKDLKAWGMLPNAEPVKEMLECKIRETGLKTYLFKHSHMYVSISTDQLGKMFGLDDAAVFSIVSQMIINEELLGSWDQPSKSIVMHSSEPSKLQFLAMQFADKATTLVENNEKLFDQRTGSNNYSWDNRGRGGGGGGGGDWNGGGRRGGGNRRQYQGQRQNYYNHNRY